MDPKSERQMLPRAGTVDDEFVCPLDRLLVAVAGDVPHRQLVAGPDLFATELGVHNGGATHIGKRGLPADDLWHHAGDEIVVLTQLAVFLRMLVDRP